MSWVSLILRFVFFVHLVLQVYHFYIFAACWRSWFLTVLNNYVFLGPVYKSDSLNCSHEFWIICIRVLRSLRLDEITIISCWNASLVHNSQRRVRIFNSWFTFSRSLRVRSVLFNLFYSTIVIAINIRTFALNDFKPFNFNLLLRVLRIFRVTCC